jgi:hypothetical protein
MRRSEKSDTKAKKSDDGTKALPEMPDITYIVMNPSLFDYEILLPFAGTITRDWHFLTALTRVQAQSCGVIRRNSLSCTTKFLLERRN